MQNSCGARAAGCNQPASSGVLNEQDNLQHDSRSDGGKEGGTPVQPEGFALALLTTVCGLGPLEAGDVPRPRSDVTRPLALRLAWLDVTEHGAGARDVVWSESRSIFREAGIEVTWRQATERESARSGEIRVVFVDRVLVDRLTRRPILGVTPAWADGPHLVWVHVGSVRAVLGIPQHRAAHALPVAARRDLSVALGRVVAHEVVHAVVPSLGHGEALMAKTLTRSQLTSARMSIGPAAAHSVRAELRRGPAPPTGQAAVLTAVEGAAELDGGR